MKRLMLLSLAAVCAFGAGTAGANQATNKSTFTLDSAEGITAAGQVVATRGKKSDPVWHSLSVTLDGARAVDDNGTTEATEEMPDPTADDYAIDYCLLGRFADGPDEDSDDEIRLLDRSTVDQLTGRLVLDAGMHEPLPVEVAAFRCDSEDMLAHSTSPIIAPPSSAK